MPLDPIVSFYIPEKNNYFDMDLTFIYSYNFQGSPPRLHDFRRALQRRWVSLADGVSEEVEVRHVAPFAMDAMPIIPRWKKMEKTRFWLRKIWV